LYVTGSIEMWVRDMSETAYSADAPAVMYQRTDLPDKDVSVVLADGQAVFTSWGRSVAQSYTPDSSQWVLIFATWRVQDRITISVNMAASTESTSDATYLPIDENNRGTKVGHGFVGLIHNFAIYNYIPTVNVFNTPPDCTGECSSCPASSGECISLCGIN
jgi:hypothetical protein